MTSWAMLKTYGKTPVELGVASWDEVDQWWADAMLLISEGFEAGQENQLILPGGRHAR